MTDNDELMDLVQTSLKVLAKDIGERLKSFENRISFLEELIKNLSPAGNLPLGIEKEPSFDFKPSMPVKTAEHSVTTGLLSATPNTDRIDSVKDDKKKEDLLDAIKIIDSL